MASSETEIIFAALIAWVIVVNVECMFLHTRYGGSMKRGVKIWSEILPEDMKRFLRRLSGDIFDEETGAFIRKENNVILVQCRHAKKWWQSKGIFMYIAYIDLRVREPRIQYRVPISPFPFLILWMIGVAVAVWMSFQDLTALLAAGLGVLMLYAIHILQRKEMLRFIREKMQVSCTSYTLQPTQLSHRVNSSIGQGERRCKKDIAS